MYATIHKLVILCETTQKKMKQTENKKISCQHINHI